MPAFDKVLYTAHTHTVGGREGFARSSDGHLDIRLSPPGQPGNGSNPEQLFAAGWSACFLGAIKIAAGRLKLAVPTTLAVDAEVELGMTDGAFALGARLKIILPGIERSVAEQLIAAAHETCPYSRATRHNIEVVLELA